MSRINLRKDILGRTNILRSMSNTEQLQDCKTQGKARIMIEFKIDNSQKQLKDYFILLRSKKFNNVSKFLDLSKKVNKKVISLINLKKPTETLVITEQGKSKSVVFRRVETKSRKKKRNTFGYSKNSLKVIEEMDATSEEYFDLKYCSKRKFKNDGSINNQANLDHLKRKGFIN